VGELHDLARQGTEQFEFLLVNDADTSPHLTPNIMKVSASSGQNDPLRLICRGTPQFRATGSPDTETTLLNNGNFAVQSGEIALVQFCSLSCRRLS
jgi:hypothetical protein